MSAQSWPSIAIVTPSFNRATFLDACLASVIDQQYPRLQYVVMDGGSTDGSPGMIKARSRQLHYWQSQADNGAYQAVADAFARTDAEILGWINADDLHLPWTLHVVGGIFRDCPEVDWITTEAPLEVAADGLPYTCWRFPGFSRRGFRAGENLPGPQSPAGAGFIQQESTFWRRTLWDKAGGRFDGVCRLAGDFELWDRYFDHAQLYCINIPLAAFRRHGLAQASVGGREQYLAECAAVLARHGRAAPDTQAFVARIARMAGLAIPELERVREPIHVVRRSSDTGRFFTKII
ncbi:MAG: glycosyltransferase [Gammaproteobacteria bacterium]|nr:MAG: glycosyltransferase [Gammaproteobacteria bacterium]